MNAKPFTVISADFRDVEQSNANQVNPKPFDLFELLNALSLYLCVNTFRQMV